MINPVGYLRLWRELGTKPIWLKSTPEQKTILITLLMMANFREKQWEWQGNKFKVSPGQFVTSLESIVKECGQGITIQNVRTSLVRFEKLDFLTYQSTKTGRLVTILNWDLYQGSIDEPNIVANKDLTKTQQRPNKDLTTKEESNKVIKKEKNIYIDDFFETIWGMYPKKSRKASVKPKQREILYKIGIDKMTKAIENYKKTKEGSDMQYWHAGYRFFNEVYVDYLEENYVPVPAKKQTKEKQTHQKFEQREYDDVDFEKLYANTDG